MEGVGGCLQLLNELFCFLQQKKSLTCIVWWYFYLLYIFADNTNTLHAVHAGYWATFWLVQLIHVQTTAGIKVRLVIIYTKSLKFTPAGKCRIYSTHKKYQQKNSKPTERKSPWETQGNSIFVSWDYYYLN